MWLEYLIIVLSVAVHCKAVNVHIGAVLSDNDKITFLKDLIEKVNKREDVKTASLTFSSTSYIMDTNPIRSAMSICDDLITQSVHVIIASHPPRKAQSPVSVSYTCGYYGIPLIGIYARDSAFSDKASFNF